MSRTAAVRSSRDDTKVTSLALGVSLCTVIVIAGCANTARFLATRPVCPGNGNRLERVYCARFAHHSLPERLVGGVSVIANAAVDANQHVLYVHRSRHTGFGFLDTVGIELLDFGTGRALPVVHIPKTAGSDELAHTSSGPSLFDLKRAYRLHR